MARVERFEDLQAWCKARELTRMVYHVTATGQFARDFGLKDQIRRAAVSTMSNIAEGFERGGDREFSQFLAAAKASAGEVRAQLYVAVDAGFISPDEFKELYRHAREVSRLTSGFMRYLHDSPQRGSKFRHDDPD